MTTIRQSILFCSLLFPFFLSLLHHVNHNSSVFTSALAPRYSTLGALEQVVGQCAACTGPITSGEKYLEALGQKWHPEHLTCARCNQPFPDGQFVPRGRDPFCEPCYHELFSEKCQVCDRPLVGRYYETFFGEKYCEHHQNQLESCASCSRPISETLTNGGIRYPDGRAVCNLCRNQPDGTIDTTEQAEKVLTEVWKDLSQLGFEFGSEIPAIQLVERNAGGTDGITQITRHTRNGREVGQHMVIQVLHGLPRIHFASIIAHELGHVYISSRVRGLHKQVEEGLCELMACTWLATQWDDPYAKYRYQAKLKNEDPIYGDGLRAALEAVGGNALESPKLFQYVFQYGRFP